MFFKNRYIKSYGFLLIAALVFSVLFPGNRASAEPAKPEGGSTLGGEYRRIQKLVDTENPAANDQFGHSVSISGNLAVVGVPFADVSSNADQGRAYLYRRIGTSWVLEETLTASDGAAGDRFGYSVDIDDGLIIVGAPNDDITDVNGSLQDFGSVYIFSRDPLQDPEWVATKKSNVRECYPSGMSCTPDPSTGEHFGFSVAIDGDKVVVGAPDDHNIDDSSSLRLGSASVYAWSGSAWNLYESKAKGSQGNAGFGTSVDISGNTVVVGTPGFSTLSPSTIPGVGRVTIYDPFLTAGTPQEFTGDSSSDEFGLSVAVDGLNMVFGGLGQAYTSNRDVEEESPWETPIQLATEDTPVNGYGHSVAIDGNTIIVGSEYSTNKAEAYVFRRLDNDWLHRAVLQQDDVDQEDSDHFGVSVGVSGNKFIVGADLEVLNSQNSRGSASIFRYIHKTSDFDGNGRSNISVIRPNAPYEWYWYLPENEGYTGTTFGTANENDKFAPADYDGDGTTDIAVYRPSDQTWYITQSSTGDVTSPEYGASGDKPRPGDFDGDGKADLAVFRPANSTWYWTRSSDGEYGELQFGSSGDIPLLADRNGDGVSEITRYTPSTGTWRFYNLETQATETVNFGQSGDIPATGDFDGDLQYDPAVFRPSTGTWYRLDSTDGFYAIQFGASGDIPAVLDYDGDGKSDISLFRPSDGVWYIINSGYPDPTEDEYTFLQFGASGDMPAPATYQQ